MFRFFILSFFIMLQVQANTHLDKVCESTVHGPAFAQDLIIRRGSGYTSFVEKMDGTVLFESSRPLISAVTYEKSIWVLAPFDLLELNSSGELLNIYPLEHDTNNAWQGRHLSLAGNTLLIARGNAGMSAFDLVKRSMRWHSFMNEVDDGMTVAVSFDGQNALAIMATSRQNGFAGVSTWDLETGNFIRKTPFNQRTAGVIDTDAKAQWFNNSLIINNGGWIHQISQQQLQSEKAMKPRWIAHLIPANGEVNPHYMMLKGEFFFEKNLLVGCGTFTAMENGQFIRKNAVFKIPML